MYSLILFIVSSLPVFLLGKYIYNKDRNKEPDKLLAKLFFCGISSCFLVLFISEVLEIFIPFFGYEPDQLNLIELLFYVFIGVALVEEFSKWIFIYKISYDENNFDEIYDMIVYSVFVALGFAFFENLLYVFESGIVTGVIRAISAVPGHACDGVFMGYYLGLAKQSQINNRMDLKNKYMIYSLLVPTILHGIYDYCLFTGVVFFYYIFIAFVFFVYIYAVKKINIFASVNRKMKYVDNYCPNCGLKVETDYCPMCGRKHN